MPEDLEQYQPQAGQSSKRRLVKAAIFGVLLLASFVGLYFTLSMQESQAKTILLVVLSMNAIAAMVNLFRSFRPHTP
jgi:VanZ family protein